MILVFLHFLLAFYLLRFLFYEVSRIFLLLILFFSVFLTFSLCLIFVMIGCLPLLGWILDFLGQDESNISKIKYQHAALMLIHEIIYNEFSVLVFLVSLDRRFLQFIQYLQSYYKCFQFVSLFLPLFSSKLYFLTLQ